jgi:hypothetical protein
MKAKMCVLLFSLIFLPLISFAYVSGIAIQSERRASMEVTINGKLLTKTPGSFVRIKSQAGLYHLKVKVLNPDNKVWYVLRKDVQIQKGLEFYYKVTFRPDGKPEIKLVKQYPVYSKYFLNPALYTRNPIS